MKIFANILKKKSEILPLPAVMNWLKGNVWIESGREILETGSK
jgi:hypothetical protein